MLPPEYLRIILADARQLGYAFDDVWAQCVVRAAGISSNRFDWLQALGGTRDGWERAYDGLPATLSERMLLAVGDDRRRDRSLDARRCEYCDRWIPIDRDPRARFCTDRCKRAQNYVLERQQVRASRPAD